MLVATPMPPLDRVPSAVGLITDFEREVTQVTIFSAYAYAAAQVIINASQRGNATTRTTLLHSLQQGGTFTTLVGQFSFNISGDPLIPNIFVYSVGEQRFQVRASGDSHRFRTVTGCSAYVLVFGNDAQPVGRTRLLLGHVLGVLDCHGQPEPPAPKRDRKTSSEDFHDQASTRRHCQIAIAA